MNNRRILFEPFRIKSVEQMPLSTEDQRTEWIREAGYNVFALRANQVTIDLLTDSGTGAMSDHQWAEMIRADESYAGSRSFLELEETVQGITGLPFVIPVHQGRAAEHLLFSELVERDNLIPSNGHFDTTLANIEDRGATGVNLLHEDGKDPYSDAPFKGNIDLIGLERLLKEEHARIPFVMISVTNNASGGQPVSLANIRGAAALCREFQKPCIIDACRFAENAFFIKKREAEYAHHSAREIAHEMFSLCDGMTFSGKKDALSNIGGLVCVRDQLLAERIKNRLIVYEGFPTYGGLAGYSLAAMSQGLKEVLDERYLEYRLRTTEWMVEKLIGAEIPVLRPSGGHAIYIDSKTFFPHIPQHHLPGITLTTQLYVTGGIRCCELGTVAFGKTLPRTQDGEDGQQSPALDLVRLALPRRTYTEAHMGYVVECLIELYNRRSEYGGFRFQVEAPVMRHFRSTFAPVR